MIVVMYFLNPEDWSFAVCLLFYMVDALMEEGATEDETVDGHHHSVDTSLSKLQEMAKGRGSLVCCSP